MSYNRFGFMQGSQQSTSQGYNYGYSQQSQGWVSYNNFLNKRSSILIFAYLMLILAVCRSGLYGTSTTAILQ